MKTTTSPRSFYDVFQRLDANTLTTEQKINEVYRRDLTSYFANIETYLQNKDIKSDDCLAFECQNSTTAIIIFLALLYRGQHILLLPPQNNPLKEPGFKPTIPEFCKSHITASPGEANPDSISSLINIYPHTEYDNAAFTRLAPGTERLLLLRTSGSMGDAKIVRFSHAHLLGNAANCVERFELIETSRVSIAVPVFHQYGLSAAFIPALLSGASIDLQENTNILRYMEHERRFKPDIVYLNPTLIAMLLKGRRNDHPYTRTISAGAALPEKIYHDYRDRFGPLTNLYGSTEMGAAATTQHHLADDHPNRLLPMSGVTMTIDSQGNALLCSHPYRFDGYINAKGESLPVNTDPYNTGDIAKALGDGRIELLGRQNESTNRAGFLVQFADIENGLLLTGEVDEAIVISGKQNTIRGEKLYAFCIRKRAKNSQNITTESIRKACFEHLPRYAVPDEIILTKDFPLSESGKINRRLLQQYLPE